MAFVTKVLVLCFDEPTSTRTVVASEVLRYSV